MAISAPATSQRCASLRAAPRHHGVHPFRVARGGRPTPHAGQFLTFRVRIDGATHLRCYSMSSSPAVDEELQVTVKRVPDGVVSNWMLDTLGPGHVVEATCPAGVFVL